jgi:hypothetical protein
VAGAITPFGLLPNDEEEMICLDLLLEVMIRGGVGNKMFLSLVDGSMISRILDMGTGLVFVR